MKEKSKFTRRFHTLLAVLVPLLSITGVSVGADTQEWDKTFPKSDKVIHEKVSYPNRYGISIAADMYLPKDINKSNKYAALIVPGARHIDLYHRTEMIPFDKLESFFKENLGE